MLTFSQTEFPWFANLLSRLEANLSSESTPRDPAHDLSHILRVSHWALKLAEDEGADRATCLAAALLHDIVYLPKNDPQAKGSSTLSAEMARKWCLEMPELASRAEAVALAIRSHSWTAGIPAESMEAKVVQDADRLDALGAIGIARTFATGASMGCRLWHGGDPWASARPFNDRAFSLDHFPVKLLRLTAHLHTRLAQQEAARREASMKAYLDALRMELEAL